MRSSIFSSSKQTEDVYKKSLKTDRLPIDFSHVDTIASLGKDFMADCTM